MDVLRTSIIGGLSLLCVYPFVIYPVILAIWVKLMTRSGPIADSTPGDLPTVALVICALNEEGIICEKIENSLGLNYPHDKLTIVVISDGSTDRTAEIVREYSAKAVVLLDHKVRRGKIANLNEAIPLQTADIVVLSDANVLYEANSIGHLVARFSDRSVGCVSGKVVLTDTTPDLDGPTNQYYSLEWKLQEQSAAVYSMVGADGAMYALRRELFLLCPADTLVEDLLIPMNVIAQGKRVVLEPKAIGWEKGVESLREEFRRKIRIAAGVMQGLIRGNIWPSKAPARYWFIFVSHKLLRWWSPIIGVLAVATAILWASEIVAHLVIAVAVLMVGLSLIRVATGWKHAVFSAPFYFVFGQAAVAIGLLKGLTGGQSVMWAKRNR